MTESRRVIAVLSVVFALTANIASADRIVMKNGDRITGTVKRIWDEEVFIEPDYADEFSVDIGAVAYIDAPRDFDIEMTDGQEKSARFQGADEDDNQIMIVEGKRVTMPLSQVAELDEPEKYFEWYANSDLNYALDKGNTDSQDLKLTGQTMLKWGDDRHIFDLLFAREEQNNVATKKQDLFRYNYNWIWHDPWFLSTIASYERDPIKDLDFRWGIAPGIGHDIWDDAGRTFNIQVALGYQQEKAGGETSAGATAGWLMRFRYHWRHPDVTFYNDNSFTTNLSGRSNNVLKTVTGLRYEITDLLYLNTELDFDYETDPASGANNEDLSVLVGLGVEFD